MTPTGNAPAAASERARVELVAHRGMPRERMENTLPSFERALDRGADAIELDVHVSADGVVVVHHDDTVRGAPILRTAWRDLSAIDLGGGARIPTLETVLQLVGDRATVYIELKGERVETPAIVAARKWGRRFAMHSFDHAAVERVAAAAPDIPRGVLLDRNTAHAAVAMRTAVARTGARDVWPHWSLVDASFMIAARELGVRVIVWTVNAPGTARALRDGGVSGICTDDVSLLANL